MSCKTCNGFTTHDQIGCKSSVSCQSYCKKWFCGNLSPSLLLVVKGQKILVGAQSGHSTLSSVQYMCFLVLLLYVNIVFDVI